MFNTILSYVHILNTFLIGLLILGGFYLYTNMGNDRYEYIDLIKSDFNQQLYGYVFDKKTGNILVSEPILNPNQK